MRELFRTAPTKINYTNDTAGNRIGKKVIKFGSPTVSYTWYVRDAAGNALHEYTAIKDTIPSDSSLSPFGLVWAGSHVYGSSRLGVQNQYLTAEPPYGQGATYNLYRGQKFYEISNHLGNVLAVVSDKKIGHTTNGTTLDYYNPDIISATDYYPFGMVSRSAYLSNLGLTYHYGFNGKENDADVKGDGNQIDYGMRVYDPRLGKFLSVDPITNEYPGLTPYQFASNTPIQAIDLDGLEAVYAPSSDLPSRYPWDLGYIINHKFKEQPKPEYKPLTNAELRREKEKINAMTFKVTTTIVALTPVGRGAQLGGTLLKVGASYLGKKTVEAGIDVFAQLATNNFDINKVDWIDVGTNYLPSIGGKWGDVITIAYKNVIEATTDYTIEKGKGLESVFNGKKDLNSAGLEALVGAVVDNVYGVGNEVLKKQFERAGFNKKDIENKLKGINERQREAVKELVKNQLQKMATEAKNEEE